MQLVHRIAEIRGRGSPNLRRVEFEREMIALDPHGISAPRLGRGERGAVGEREVPLALEVETTTMIRESPSTQ